MLNKEIIKLNFSTKSRTFSRQIEKNNIKTGACHFEFILVTLCLNS